MTAKAADLNEQKRNGTLPSSPDVGAKPIAVRDAKPANETKPLVTWMATSEIFAPLDPIDWAIPGLYIGPGRPTMIAGYGFSKKTLSVQSAALSIASGTKVWGQFPSGPPRRVRHFDHEQGQRATKGRYQRLAAGMGLTQDDLGGRLELTCFPTLYLNSPGAEDAYTRELEGVDVAIGDALRGMTPGVDENDSIIGAHLNMLARVSEKTGTSFILVHHAGKPKDGHSDGRTVPRGSSAIFDACGTVMVLSGAKNEPSKVSMEKTAAEAEGAASEDFFLAVEDVLEDDTARKIGVRIAYRTTEQINPPRSRDDEQRGVQGEVVEALRRSPGASATEIRMSVGGKASAVDAAIDMLVRTERVRRVPGRAGTKTTHTLTEAT